LTGFDNKKHFFLDALQKDSEEIGADRWLEKYVKIQLKRYERAFTSHTATHFLGIKGRTVFHNCCQNCL